ncbi:hypothetical protein [Nitrosococcus watsonii]|uniref:Secretin/TonB short N-terminal domain-containing protein n=1 Tax=Nitrosococcus watsoni (strain C-113) TaxID=105559 RepID=D8K964_NITWC|nr:hypothetical protein [Nitrosococcus watsonii]ADJ29207.1 conserved hypothetical protein [Nitrosococcus watsonii C-113]
MKIKKLLRCSFGILVLLAGGEIAAQNLAGASFKLSVKDNVVSFQGEGALLGEVLAELERQTDIKIHVSDSVATEPIPLSFDDFPLAEGLKLLLRGRNYILTYQKPLLPKDRDSPPKIAEIRVLPDGEAKEVPTEAQKRASPQQVPPTSSQKEKDESNDIEE